MVGATPPHRHVVPILIQGILDAVKDYAASGSALDVLGGNRTQASAMRIAYDDKRLFMFIHGLSYVVTC
jgi:hypothetical protein